MKYLLKIAYISTTILFFTGCDVDRDKSSSMVGVDDEIIRKLESQVAAIDLNNYVHTLCTDPQKAENPQKNECIEKNGNRINTPEKRAILNKKVSDFFITAYKQGCTLETIERLIEEASNIAKIKGDVGDIIVYEKKSYQSVKFLNDMIYTSFSPENYPRQMGELLNFTGFR
jgi:hypothetical protein